MADRRDRRSASTVRFPFRTVSPKVKPKEILLHVGMREGAAFLLDGAGNHGTGASPSWSDDETEEHQPDGSEQPLQTPATATPHLRFDELPPILAVYGSPVYEELQRRGRMLRSFVDSLGAGKFWKKDATSGPPPGYTETTGWALTKSLAHIAFDHVTYARVYVAAFHLVEPTALDLYGWAVQSGWGFRLTYEPEDLERFKERAPRPSKEPEWVADRTAPYGYLERGRSRNVSALNARYLKTITELIASRPHLNQTVQDGGNIVAAVYQHYAGAEDLLRLQDGPSACLLYYGEVFNDQYGRVYERTHSVERNLLLGVVYDRRMPDYVGWIWPPEDVWLSSGRFALGALQTEDLEFVRRRASMISAGSATPLSAAQWRKTLRLGRDRRGEASAASAILRNVHAATYDVREHLDWGVFNGLLDLEQCGESIKGQPGDVQEED
jgi:hypothetical protein